MGKNDTEPLIFEQVSYLITQNKTQEPDYYEGINFYFNLFILSPFIAFEIYYRAYNQFYKICITRFTFMNDNVSCVNHYNLLRWYGEKKSVMTLKLD